MNGSKAGSRFAPLLLDERISIATAAYGNAVTTRRCLESIFRSASGPFELILVDDCSPDSGAVRTLFLEVQRRHTNTRVFSFSENLEYSGSLNAVLSHARGQSIVFVSNDVFITPFYLRQLLKASQENPRMGILRGSSNFVDNGLATHNVTLPRPVSCLNDLFEIGAEFAQAFGHATQPDPFLVGDAFLVKRSVIEQIGTLDPWFYGYFADPDYALRAQVAGFELGVVRGAFAYHQRDANFGYLPDDLREIKLHRRWMRVLENWARFKLKWGLPIPLPYSSISSVPWSQLAATAFDTNRHYSKRGEYCQHLL